jgi:hypothetical protein
MPAARQHAVLVGWPVVAAQWPWSSRSPSRRQFVDIPAHTHEDAKSHDRDELIRKDLIHMRLRRLLTTASILGVLAPLGFVALSATVPGVAAARCAGSTEIRSTLVVGGVEVVAEKPLSGTCNGNNTYQGEFAAKISGWRASVWIQNNGVWTPYRGGFDVSGHPYKYADNNSNSYMSLCIDDGAFAYCGWGTSWVYSAYYDHTFYGVNYGF